MLNLTLDLCLHVLHRLNSEVQYYESSQSQFAVIFKVNLLLIMVFILFSGLTPYVLNNRQYRLERLSI